MRGGAQRKCVAELGGNDMTGRKYGQLDCNSRPNEQLWLARVGTN